MNVVIVNESVPYPATAGNRIRTLNLMTRLAKRHQVTYLCRGSEDAAETQQARDYLNGQGIRMVVADTAPQAKSGVAFYGRLAANLFSPLPYAIASHNSQAMRQAIREMASKGNVDLWQFEWLAYADALADYPEARTLLMAHNVESLIWQRYVQTERNVAKKIYLNGQWQKFQKQEAELFRAVNGVVCVSEDDARLAGEQFAARRTWVVENGVDRAYFEQAVALRQHKTILFLGSLDWRPNQDAVRLLISEVFPQVRKLEPGAVLCIVGRRPPKWLVDKVASTKQVELYADVADVRPYLAAATVMAVPLRVGGGSRLKILEAMACGLPVVSTPVGYEGLSLMPARDLVVTDQMDDFARQLVWVMRNTRKAQEMASRGRQLVYQRYDWDPLAAKLERVWEEAAASQQVVSPPEWMTNQMSMPAN